MPAITITYWMKVAWSAYTHAAIWKVANFFVDCSQYVILGFSRKFWKSWCLIMQVDVHESTGTCILFTMSHTSPEKYTRPCVKRLDILSTLETNQLSDHKICFHQIKLNFRTVSLHGHVNAGIGCKPWTEGLTLYITSNITRYCMVLERSHKPSTSGIGVSLAPCKLAWYLQTIRTVDSYMSCYKASLPAPLPLLEDTYKIWISSHSNILHVYHLHLKSELKSSDHWLRFLKLKWVNYEPSNYEIDVANMWIGRAS